MKLTYAFDANFPDSLLPAARRAMSIAAKAWNESTFVKVIEEPGHGDTNVTVCFKLLKPSVMEDGGVRAAPMAFDHDSREIVVNSAYSWQSSRWQFWKLIMLPADLAHEIGHAIGLPHTRQRFACMRQGSAMLPQWYDFQSLRAMVAREHNTIL